jgi:hypothetical protein
VLETAVPVVVPDCLEPIRLPLGSCPAPRDTGSVSPPFEHRVAAL